MKDYIDIQAAVVKAKGENFILENLKLNKPNKHEVLVKIIATGMCHTDLIVRDQFMPVPLPAVLGHEGSGIVVEIGSDVKDLSVGDHVVLGFDYCAKCLPCENGDQAYCTDFYNRNFGGSGPDGKNSICDDHKPIHDHFFGQSSFATYAIATEANAIKVSKDAPIELLGPLGCGIQTGAGAAINSLKVKPATSFVIIGAGAVGLSALMAAKICGATTLIAVDIVESRLELAKELGATHTINSKNVDFVEEIKRITGTGANYVLETSGIPALVTQGIAALAVKGKIGIVGAPPLGTLAGFDVIDLIVTGKKIIGICEGDSKPKVFIPLLVDLYLKGVFPFDKLVKFYSFEEINQAALDSTSGKTLKPILKIGNL